MAFRQNNVQDIYEYSYSQSPYGYHTYISDGNAICVGEDANFWTNPNQRSGNSQNVIGRSTYYSFSNNVPFGNDDLCRGGNAQYRSGCTPNSMGSEVDSGSQLTTVPFVRVVKRRTTANKKERRRTQSINNAYSELRDCIPNVPADTKLSKIKTLRLATSYISYLTAVLETNEPVGGFKVELNANSRKILSTPVIQTSDCSRGPSECDISAGEDGGNNSRRVKGRTGWPQHVWALELKQEQSL